MVFFSDLVVGQVVFMLLYEGKKEPLFKTAQKTHQILVKKRTENHIIAIE